MIKEQITKIKERIAVVSSKIHKNPDLVTIVAVSKGRLPAQITEVIQAGIDNIGENRVQEAISKINEITSQLVSEQRIKWHMVGHLQTNKVKEAVRLFDLIHSVDSIKLAQEINKQAAGMNKIQDILIEVKTSPEATKSGLKPDDVIGVMKEIAQLKNIKIKGLMTIAPLMDDPQKTRPYFRMLRELQVQANHELSASAKRSVSLPEGKSEASPKGMNYELTILSMGMTDDFEVAIEEGSNMVRLGRAIFGTEG